MSVDLTIEQALRGLSDQFNEEGSVVCAKICADAASHIASLAFTVEEREKVIKERTAALKGAEEELKHWREKIEEILAKMKVNSAQV